MGRTPNALEQSPHDPTCGITRAGNNVDYHEIILGNGTSTCQPPAGGCNRTQGRGHRIRQNLSLLGQHPSRDPLPSLRRR